MHPLNQKPDSRSHSTAFFTKQVEMNLAYCIWYQHTGTANRICYESHNLTVTEIRNLQHTWQCAVSHRPITNKGLARSVNESITFFIVFDLNAVQPF